MKEVHTHPTTRFQSKAHICGICYGFIEKQGNLDSCKHTFCSKCIETWSKIENTCPLCKQKFSTIETEWRRIHYRSIKIAKKKSKNSKKVIKVEDKSQSETYEEQSLWWELLIEFILSDSTYLKIKLVLI